MPPEDRMLFFTPDLYRRYNSPDEDAAIAADADWEAAIVRYHEYLTSLREKISSQVYELSRLCLHDGVILLRQERQEPVEKLRIDARPLFREWPNWCGVFTLVVKLEDTLVTLCYFLCDHASEKSSEEWQFSRENEHWLYDEVHWHQNEHGHFTHVILLSTGVVLSIPFSAVLVSRFSASPANAENGKQSA
jgi:hypothetical protein